MFKVVCKPNYLAQLFSHNLFNSSNWSGSEQIFSNINISSGDKKAYNVAAFLFHLVGFVWNC